MGQKYEQLSLEQRCTIARQCQAGQTIRQIAAAMDRAPSTIARELKRNSGSKVGYQPAYAEQQAKSRRWKGSRLIRDPSLQALVLKRLGQGWSPAQVAGRLKKQHRRNLISYESIYRFIDSQIRRTKDYSWRHYLPRAKSKRGWRGHKGGSPVEHIEGRVAIDRRPAYIHKRRQPGHWEGDLMLFAKYGQAVLVSHERRSRLLVVSRQPNKAANPVATKLMELFCSLPKSLRRTITFDNGTEFAYHYRLHQLSMRTFFCDPHAPWQKGGIENAIGRMRRGLPRKTDLATLSDHHLLSLVRSYNHTPRKCLNYNTPAEVFTRDLLHFKCESTFPLSRERRNTAKVCSSEETRSAVMKNWRWVLIALIWFLSLSLGTQLASAQSPSAEVRKVEAAKKGMVYLTREEIIAGAKREGNVKVFPGVDEKAVPLLVEAFKKKYPFIEAKGGMVSGIPAIQRQIFEMAAGKADLDVFHAHTGFRNDYVKNNLYKKYDFKAMVEDSQLKLPPRAIDEVGGFILSGANLGVLLYSTKLVPAEKAPTGWESCLDPQWKGKFAVDTRPYLLARLAARWSEEKVLDFAAKLKANDPIWTRGHTTSLERLISGELSIICGISMHVWLRKAKNDSNVPVKMVVPSPLGVAFFESHAVYAQAKNPNAALLWVEFFASKDGQEIVESLEPGRASFVVEGTAANKVAKEANVSLCDGVCRDREEKLIERIAVEAWKFPKVGYIPN